MQNSENISVLLVEDNFRPRNLLCDFLSDEGFKISNVPSDVEMNAALEVHMPTIVILDLNRPGKEGICIANRVNKSFPHLGLIILSASDKSIDSREGYSAGADVYLSKPTHPEEITHVIRNLHARLESVKEVTS